MDADLFTTIEAKNENEAKDILDRMELSDLIEQCNINNFVIKEVEVEGVEEEHKKLKVKVSNIDWDIDEDEEAPEFALPTEDEFEVEVDSYHGEVDSADEEQAIADHLEYEYGFTIKTFEYEVVENLD